MKRLTKLSLLFAVIGIIFIANANAKPDSSTTTTNRLKTPHGLHVNADGRLMKNGEPYRGIGVNYFNAFYRTLNGKDKSTRAGLHYLKSKNIPFIRFMAGAYWPNQWKLYRENKPAYFAKMDAFVKAAEDESIGLIPSLFWQINTIPDIVFEPIEKWGDSKSETMEFMRTYTREVVNRYKNSPAIWGWEFGNEMNLEVDLPHHKPQVSVENGTPFMRTWADQISTNDMRLAYTEFAKTVRSIDDYRIIISGNANPRSSAWHLMHDESWDKDTAEQYRQMLALQNPDEINTISVHIYPDHENQYFEGTSTSLSRLIQTAADAARELKKPLFIGEFGASRKLSSAEAHDKFQEFLDAIVAADVPLSAVWVFDYSPQDKDWNITPDNGREYQLDAISELNKKWEAERQ